MLTHDDAHQSQALLTAVAVAEGHVVGIGRCHREQGAERRHAHLLGHTREALLQTGDGRDGIVSIVAIVSIVSIVTIAAIRAILAILFLLLVFFPHLFLFGSLCELFSACVDALHGGRHHLTVVVVLGVEVVDELAAVGLLEEVGHSLGYHGHRLGLREQTCGPDAEDGQQGVVA